MINFQDQIEKYNQCIYCYKELCIWNKQFKICRNCSVADNIDYYCDKKNDWKMMTILKNNIMFYFNISKENPQFSSAQLKTNSSYPIPIELNIKLELKQIKDLFINNNLEKIMLFI